jgi:hypothetical protein
MNRFDLIKELQKKLIPKKPELLVLFFKRRI